MEKNGVSLALIRCLHVISFNLLKAYILRMKLSAYFLLILVIGMVFTPCSDAFLQFSVNENAALSIQEDNHTHCDEDHCTPFCTCACCHIQVENCVTLLVVLETISDRSFVSISQNRSFLRIHSIWDPPKS